MPFVPAAPPTVLHVVGPIAAVTIDAQRRRVFAAGARSIAVLDADTGVLLATIRLGGARSIAVEPLGGHVFAGTSDGRISEIDPDRKAIVRSASAGTTAIDVLLYDAVSGRLYADGGGAPNIAVVDGRTLKRTGSVAFPGSRPGSMVPDPVTRDLYVSGSTPEVSIVNVERGAVRMTFRTPGLLGNSIVRFDDALGQIAVAGANGVLAIYDRAGTERARISIPQGIVACDLDTSSHVLACTGPLGLSFVQLKRDGAPATDGTAALSGLTFAAFDGKTHDVHALRSNLDGTGTDFEIFHAVDGRDTHPIP